MIKTAIQISTEHGQEMRRLALVHAVELAKVYRDCDGTLDDLIDQLTRTLVEEAQPYHNRFDEDHRKWCGDCRGHFNDFLLDQHDEQEQQ